MNDRESCVLCKQDEYLHPTMKLMNSVCGHKFCESCVTIRFMKNSTMMCPLCNMKLTKNSLMRSDDSNLEKENTIRKRVLKVYNRRQEDFPNLDSYNDYLEKVEDLIFNLINQIDVESTTEEIQRYQRENQDSITINAAKRASEEQTLAARIVEEKLKQEQRRVLRQQQDLEETLQKEKKKEETKKIQNAPNQNTTQNAPPPTKQQTTQPMQISQPPPQPTPTPTPAPIPQPIIPTYQPAQAQNVFRQPQPVTAIASLPTQNNISTSDSFSSKTQLDSAKAGGFNLEIIKKRSLEEAFNCLLFK
eukprot:TRINITY_DN2061_c0_g1_i1.p1 TRINITY_DN2061_c0_g1~~TRINITY_DN2061_c0_g1_i1.p1  ORF type:complete len:304 (+),score=75.07 TRINITY_DN2061_c0_g1_i1:104-1015(+)